MLGARQKTLGILVGGLIAIGYGGLAGAADPYSPGHYLGQKELIQGEAAAALVSQGVYSLDGRRYLKYSSAESSVWLPAIGDLPDLHPEFALCEEHLRLLREVLRRRDGLPLEPYTKAHSSALITLIQRCRDGKVAGPVRLERQPDGAVVEIKSQGKPNVKPSTSVGTKVPLP